MCLNLNIMQNEGDKVNNNCNCGIRGREGSALPPASLIRGNKEVRRRSTEACRN